ncbi:hypothetical protein KOW79_002463 [Hemibagrus wyckioides]|uniref:Uncharacterized protein n=1 Tax=Hemibagrus wyckioides TaxID=337641 RepID=A0A9D3SQY7_9TELE|nr:hypothetical protein KOW79_002463 [Hemibagrus wyckioides]
MKRRLIQSSQTRATPPLELKRFELNERHARCAGGRCSSERGEKELPHRLYEGRGGGGGATQHTASLHCQQISSMIDEDIRVDLLNTKQRNLPRPLREEL